MPRAALAAIMAAILIFGTGLAVLAWAFFHPERPVLTQWFRETNCACGDYQEQLSGIVFFNPFRDRSPERSADDFFRAIRTHRCPLNSTAAVCEYSWEGHVVDGWRLANSTVEANAHVFLFYHLRKTSQPQWTGQGVVEVQRMGNKWQIVSYDSYF